MKRRKFLYIAGIGSLAAAVAAWRYATISFDDVVGKVIFDELHWLKLDKKGVKRFIADYTKAMTPRNKVMLERYSFVGVPSSHSLKISRMINSYLLSTDFFLHGMDETRTIKYIGLYDPIRRACANPFNQQSYPNT
jgi:hypothetical protein